MEVQPEAVFQDYYTNYFYYYTHYFPRLTRIAIAVSTSYALQIYVHRFNVSQQAQGTSEKLPLPSEASKLCCFCAIISHYITIIAIIFSIICIIQKQRIAFGVVNKKFSGLTDFNFFLSSFIITIIFYYNHYDFHALGFSLMIFTSRHRRTSIAARIHTSVASGKLRPPFFLLRIIGEPSEADGSVQACL